MPYTMLFRKTGKNICTHTYINIIQCIHKNVKQIKGFSLYIFNIINIDVKKCIFLYYIVQCKNMPSLSTSTQQNKLLD